MIVYDRLKELKKVDYQQNIVYNEKPPKGND